MAAVGDEVQARGRARLEHDALGGGQADLVLAEDDLRLNARATQSTGERAVAVHVLVPAAQVGADVHAVVARHLGGEATDAVRGDPALDHLRATRVNASVPSI
jgi:hypothetical protein